MAEYSLALGVKPLQLEDPLTSYGRFATIQNAQNQNALAQYQLGAAQRAEAKDIARTNALARAGSNTDSIAKALLDAGDLEGYGKVIKFAADQKKAEREAETSESNLLDASLKRATTALTQAPTIENFSSVIDAVYNPTTPTGKFFASVGHDVNKVKALIADAATDPTGQKFLNLKATFGSQGKELLDYLGAQAQAAQLRSPPSPVGIPTETPAPTGNALVAPVAGVSNAMLAQPPAPTTFAAGRLAKVEQEIGQMQDVLASYPGNKLATERLKLATEIRDKLVAEVSPKPVAVNLNGTEVFIDMNPSSSTFKQEILSKQKTAAPAGPTDLARLQAERTALIAKNPKDPLIKEYDQRIATLTTHQPASSTITNVNAYAPASVTAQQEFMKETRENYGRLRDAPGVLDNIEKAKGLVKGAKGFMGPGGESLQQAASFLNNRLGTKIDTKGVSDAAELRSRLFLGIMDNLKKLDSQPTERQQDALQAALGSLGTDPNALPRVLDAFGDSVRNRVERHNQEVTGAETRGVKFPYDPKITLPERVAAAAASSIPDAAIAALKSGKGNAKQFDEIFGAGAAARVLGGGK